jgi:hypothetical protein
LETNHQAIKDEVMLIEVQKKVTETVEFKTPAYYKTALGHAYINEAGQLVSVRNRMIFMWEPSEGKFYAEDIEDLMRNGTPCTKEEYDKAFAEVYAKLALAADAVEF